MARVRTWVRVSLALEVLVEMPNRPPAPEDDFALQRLVNDTTEVLTAAVYAANRNLAAGVDAHAQLRETHKVEVPPGAVQLTLSPTGAVSMMQITSAAPMAFYDDRNEAIRECFSVTAGTEKVPPFRPAEEVKAEQEAQVPSTDTVGDPLLAELLAQASRGTRGIVLDFPIKELPEDEDDGAGEGDAAGGGEDV